jgi:hypothetical protein
VYSFDDDEVGSSWVQFAESFTVVIRKNTENIEKERKEEPVEEDSMNDLWFQTTVDAGKFHRALRNKLISIRDT